MLLFGMLHLFLCLHLQAVDGCCGSFELHGSVAVCRELGGMRPKMSAASQLMNALSASGMSWERAFVMPTRLARLPPTGVCDLLLLELFWGALWRRLLPKISWARFSALRFWRSVEATSIACSVDGVARYMPALIMSSNESVGFSCDCLFFAMVMCDVCAFLAQ